MYPQKTIHPLNRKYGPGRRNFMDCDSERGLYTERLTGERTFWQMIPYGRFQS